MSHEPYLVCNFSLIAVYELFPNLILFISLPEEMMIVTEQKKKKILVTFPCDFPLLVLRVVYNARRNLDDQ